MIEAARKIELFRRRVLWRTRLLALQDHLSLALAIAGLVSAAFILYSRLRPSNLPAWTITAAVFAAATGAMLARWYFSRARARDSAFLIDETLRLEDRVASAWKIIERGGPDRAIELALIDDASSRVENAQASSVVRYRLPHLYGFALVALAALALAVAIPEKALPGGEARAEARADIQAAGELLEQTAEEVQQGLDPQNETANLAKEQAELGRAFRRTTGTRADALNKLSALEGRIKQRHEALASTRADEIISLAERRLRSALQTKPEKQRAEQPSQAEPSRKLAQGDGMNNSKEVSAKTSDSASDSNKNAGPDPKQKPGQKTDGNRALTEAANNNSSSKSAQTAGAENKEQSSPESRAQEPPASQAAAAQNLNRNSASPEPPDRAPEEQKAQVPEAPEQGDDKKGEMAESNLPGALAEQAAKQVPGLSEELLKKAEQLRAGELTSADIKQLQFAAELLARDLARIAESKEFQQTIEQLARQVNPEQLERVARELMKNEKLRQELEATARMLAENRQIKEMVAGLARRFEALRPPMPKQPGGDSRPRSEESALAGDVSEGSPRNNRNGPAARLNRALDAHKSLTGGKQSNLNGNVQGKAGGEYLFLQSRPGAGAARAPYSSAYPQYRRQAERSVERTQIPAHKRSKVRSYFDAINPDGKKQQ